MFKEFLKFLFTGRFVHKETGEGGVESSAPEEEALWDESSKGGGSEADEGSDLDEGLGADLPPSDLEGADLEPTEEEGKYREATTETMKKTTQGLAVERRKHIAEVMKEEEEKLKRIVNLEGMPFKETDVNYDPSKDKVDFIAQGELFFLDINQELQKYSKNKTLTDLFRNTKPEIFEGVKDEDIINDLSLAYASTMAEQLQIQYDQEYAAFFNSTPDRKKMLTEGTAKYIPAYKGGNFSIASFNIDQSEYQSFKENNANPEAVEAKEVHMSKVWERYFALLDSAGGFVASIFGDPEFPAPKDANGKVITTDPKGGPLKIDYYSIAAGGSKMGEVLAALFGVPGYEDILKTVTKIAAALGAGGTVKALTGMFADISDTFDSDEGEEAPKEGEEGETEVAGAKSVNSDYFERLVDKGLDQNVDEDVKLSESVNLGDQTVEIKLADDADGVISFQGKNVEYSSGGSGFMAAESKAEFMGGSQVKIKGELPEDMEIPKGAKIRVV